MKVNSRYFCQTFIFSKLATYRLEACVASTEKEWQKYFAETFKKTYLAQAICENLCDGV